MQNHMMHEIWAIFAKWLVSCLRRNHFRLHANCWLHAFTLFLSLSCSPKYTRVNQLKKILTVIGKHASFYYYFLPSSREINCDREERRDFVYFFFLFTWCVPSFSLACRYFQLLSLPSGEKRRREEGRGDGRSKKREEILEREKEKRNEWFACSR